MAARALQVNNLCKKIISNGSRAPAATFNRWLTYDIETPSQFDEKVLKSEVPVIVDFHAEWCRPCKILGPTLKAVLDSYDGKVDFAKVDVDEVEDVAMEFDVRSIPTVLGMKNGKVVSNFVGAQSEEFIKDFVDDLLEK